jgi:DNA-3-methyladenine glycosylase II
MPEFSELVKLEGDDIAEAIGHARKGAQIAGVVRGVAAIGARFLTTAPYDQARDALLQITGVGPFSAAAILLRGLGRMDELPWMDQFDHAGSRVYGARFDRRAIEQRYAKTIGYWAYYCMNSSRVGDDVTVGRRGRPSMSSTVAR